jgi:hypothetical protein
MKSKLQMQNRLCVLTLLLLTLHSSPAQDLTYITNLFYAISYPTNWYLGTNGTDAGGDSFQVIANKLNHDVNWLWTEDLNRSNDIVALKAVSFTNTIPVAGGLIYPSNTWNLTTITSAMPNFSIWQGNSNGLAFVSVYTSNGVARVKQLVP